MRSIPSSAVRGRVLAGAIALVGGLSASLLPAASAQAAAYYSGTAYSTDLHARTAFTVTFYGTQHAAVTWTNADVKAVLPGPLKLDDVWVEECNGGSHDAPQRCDTVDVANYYH